MKNIFSNIFGISKRSSGTIEDDGTVNIQEILSYDLVASPGCYDAMFDFSEIKKRKELLKARKEKLKKLNNL